MPCFAGWALWIGIPQGLRHWSRIFWRFDMELVKICHGTEPELEFTSLSLKPTWIEQLAFWKESTLNEPFPLSYTRSFLFPSILSEALCISASLSSSYVLWEEIPPQPRGKAGRQKHTIIPSLIFASGMGMWLSSEQWSRGRACRVRTEEVFLGEGAVTPGAAAALWLPASG